MEKRWAVTFCALHVTWSFPLTISSVNENKSAVSYGLVIFTEEILDEKLNFCAVVDVSFKAEGEKKNLKFAKNRNSKLLI